MSLATEDEKQIPIDMEKKTEGNTVLWVGNLDDKATEPILYELFQQAGPVKCIKIPKDGSTYKGYCFIQFLHADSVPYTVKVMEGTHLYGKKLKFQPQPDSIHANRLPDLLQELFTQLES